LPDTAYHHRHGHDSYWTRFVRSTSASVVAFEILQPFLDRFDPADVDYMRGAGRDTWLDTLDKHPIRVTSDPPGVTGIAEGQSTTLLSRLKRLARWSR
ncbi:MAG TPA: hypothetical protein VN181_03260, partial [Thermoanaerobaculia bacterium]|nr:hypothetical protein [Thermoanaerobaculia bacterium]